MNLSFWRKASILLALLCPLAAWSQHGLYFQGDLGGTITHETHLNEFFGEDVTGAKVKFDPGVRVGVTVGYDICEWFAAEGQIGVYENTIKSITGATDIEDAALINVPFLVNLKLQLPKRCIFSPYIGGGVGGATSVFTADRLEIGGTSVHGSDGDAVFAFQGFAGFRVALNQNMGIGFEYRYFHADSPTWHSGHHDDLDGHMVIGDTQTHSFSVSFDWVF